ncbi:hypothetical protein QTP88_027359 [Uroleucon formosanum]
MDLQANAIQFQPMDTNRPTGNDSDTSQVKQTTIDTIIRDMKEQGLVEQSTSPWAAPVVLAKKKDGSPRLCIDYRRLNDITEYDAYPMPDLNTLIRQMRGAKVYSVLDLKSGYWQECVKEWSQALGLQLTVNSMVCDRHFNPEDMLYKELLIGGSKKILKVLIYPALPISINTTQSVSYASKYVPGM